MESGSHKITPSVDIGRHGKTKLPNIRFKDNRPGLVLDLDCKEKEVLQRYDSVYRGLIESELELELARIVDLISLNLGLIGLFGRFSFVLIKLP